MKLNNRGMTLVEIIVSISLVSIVMVFTLNLLTDLKSEETLGEGKTSDLLNRSIIIKTVQKDFAKGIESIGYKQGDLFKGCPSISKVGDYNITSCFSYKLKPNSDPADHSDEYYYFLITAKKGNDHYFIYAKSTSQSAIGNTYEAWKLDSASYGCLQFSHYKYNTVPEKYFSLYLPSTLSNYNSNTVMSFDLEFSYYYYGDDLPGVNLTINCSA